MSKVHWKVTIDAGLPGHVTSKSGSGLEKLKRLTDQWFSVAAKDGAKLTVQFGTESFKGRRANEVPAQYEIS